MDLTEKLEAVASQDAWRRSEQAQVLITEGLRSAEEAVRSQKPSRWQEGERRRKR